MSLKAEFIISAAAQKKVRDVYDFCKTIANEEHEKIFLVEAREAGRRSAYIIIECSEAFAEALAKKTKTGVIASVTAKPPLADYFA